MNFLKRKKGFLGLDIGSYSIKFIEIDIENNSVKLKNLGFIQLPPEIIIDGYIISLHLISIAIKKLIKGYKITANDTATAIPGNKVIIKRINIPQENYENIDDFIQFQASQYIPYEISEVSIDYDIIEKNEETSNEVEALLVATKNEIIKDYITILSENNLFPQFADIDFFALQNCYEFNYFEEENKDEIVGILNIGYNISNLVFIKNKEGLFYRDYNLGAISLTKKIASKLNLSLMEAEKVKLNNIQNKYANEAKNEFFKEIQKETSKCIELFKNNLGITEIDKIYLCGGGSMIKGLKQFLEKSFNSINFEYLNPFKNFKIDEKIDKEYLNYIKPIFGISAGLALRGLEIG